MSFVRSVDYQDPHLEPFPPPARPAFLAPVGVTNLAYRKLVTTSDRTLRAAARRKLTDGDKEAGDESVVQMAEGKQWVQVDLGSRCAVYAIVIWRHRRGFPICKGMVVQTADDEDFISNVHTWFNNDYENSLGLGVGKDKQYIESSAGKLVDTKGSEARYVRCYSNGMREEKANVYTEIEVWGLPRP